MGNLIRTFLFFKRIVKMKYAFMLMIAFIMAIFSSALTSFGLAELFGAAGMFIIILFATIDLGRFILFNFVIDEWHNLRKVKYFIAFILALLFIYSGIGVFSKLSSLVTENTREAMVNTVSYNTALENAQTKQQRSENFTKVAEDEYKNALDWNKNDLSNCIARARGNKEAENRCNNTKRALDKKALVAYKEALDQADIKLDTIEETAATKTKNQSEIANVILTTCKLTQKTCNTYDNLQNALNILIFLVIIGTDYLQIAIVLAVNTRKNKKIKKEEKELAFNTFEIVKKEEVKPIIKEIKPESIEQTIKVEPILIKKEKEYTKKDNLLKPFEKKFIKNQESKKEEVKPIKKHFFFSAKPK